MPTSVSFVGIAQVKEQHQAEMEAREGNAQDRTNGVDDAVSKAERALKEAQDKQKAAKTDPEKREAGIDVTNKEADLRDARRDAAERAVQRQDATDVAGLRGTDSQKQREKLLKEQADLTAQLLDSNSPTYQPNAEKRADIPKQLAENSAQLDSLDRADAQREFARRKNEIAANTGVGTQAKLKAIDQQLGVNQDEQKDNADHGNDKNRASQLTAEAAELNRQKKEIEISSAHELATAKAQTQEMQLQASGQTNAAQIVGIRAQYEERIAAALKNGNDELADQYKLQEKMAVQAAQLVEFRKTPKQRSDEVLASQKDAQDRKQMEIRQKRDLENKRQNYEDEHRASLDLDPAKRAAQIAAAVPDLDGVLSKKTGNGKAGESSENATDAAFNALFHKGQDAAVPDPQPDRRGRTNADPQEQKGPDDSNTSDVVDVLEDIRDILDDRLDLTIP